MRERGKAKDNERMEELKTRNGRGKKHRRKREDIEKAGRATAEGERRT
jgi:hypothetical protein